jgi:hypothetical protein
MHLKSALLNSLDRLRLSSGFGNVITRKLFALILEFQIVIFNSESCTPEGIKLMAQLWRFDFVCLINLTVSSSKQSCKLLHSCAAA